MTCQCGKHEIERGYYLVSKGRDPLGPLWEHHAGFCVQVISVADLVSQDISEGVGRGFVSPFTPIQEP